MVPAIPRSSPTSSPESGCPPPPSRTPSAPPWTGRREPTPCYYGTDIDSRENLIACHHSVEEIAQIIGVDSLGYLPVEQLGALIGQAHYCGACFTGLYPTPVPVNTRKDRFEQELSEKNAITLHQ